jgi:hypothetical protein
MDIFSCARTVLRTPAEETTVEQRTTVAVAAVRPTETPTTARPAASITSSRTGARTSTLPPAA